MCMQGEWGHTQSHSCLPSSRSEVTYGIIWSRDADYSEGVGTGVFLHPNFHSQVMQWVCNLPSPAPLRGCGAAPGTGSAPTSHPNPAGIVPVTQE